MKHHDKNRKFGRKQSERRGFLRSLMRALVLKERIKTTEARAKEIRPRVEKLVTKGRANTLTSYRSIISDLGGDEEVAQKLVKTLSPRYKERAGGYLRITKAARRKGDGSPMAVIEFV